MHYLYLLLVLIAIVSSSYLIYRLRNRIWSYRTILFFVLVLLCIILWGGGQFLINAVSINEPLFRHFNLISTIGWINLPVFFLLFTLYFTNNERVLKKSFNLLLIIIPAGYFQYISFTTHLLVYASFGYVTYIQWGYFTPVGPLFPIFFIWFVLLFIISCLLFIQFHRTTTDPTKKKQSLLILIAIIIPLLIGSVSDGFLWILNFKSISLALPLTTIMTGLIGYTLIHYELFSIEPGLVLSSIREGIITTDKHLKIITMNRSAEKMLRLSERDALYKNFSSLIKLLNEEGALITEDNLPTTLALSNGQTTEGTYLFIDTKGDRIVLYLTVAPIKVGKEIVGTTLILNDITEETKQENLKDDFISIAAHEIASPVASLKAATYFLKDELQKKQDTELTSYVEEMTRKIDHLMLLIAKVLDFSRIKTGTLILQREWVDINQLMVTAIREVNSLYPDKEITIRGEVLQTLYIDKDRIIEVVINLLTNAIKYAPESNEVQIKIEQDKLHVIVGIQDFGIGISREDKQRLFQRYQRLEESKKRRTKGLGIGLYISNEIIRSHDGNMWVESEIGKGSTFYFALPIKNGKSF